MSVSAVASRRDIGDPLLDASDVALKLGMSLRWVRQATARNELPHVRLGRSVRYIRADIDAYLHAQKTGDSSDL